MTNDKTDAGPECGDGEARGVSPPDPDPRRPWTLAQYGRAFRIPPDDARIDVWRPGWSTPLLTTWGDLTPATKVFDLYWRWAEMATGERPRPLPSWARQPMIDSAAVKHRIVQAWHDHAEHLTVLGSDGRIHFRDNEGQWIEIATYPPGLEP